VTLQPGPYVTSEYDRFAMIPEAVLFSPLPPRAIQLFGALLRFAREDAVCFPSRAELARRMHCTTKVIDRAVDDLVAFGVLRVERRGGKPGETWQSNAYHLIRRTTPSALQGTSPRGAEGTSLVPPRVNEREDTRENPRGGRRNLPGASPRRSTRATLAGTGGVPATPEFRAALDALRKRPRT
jgi:hypothetical protein